MQVKSRSSVFKREFCLVTNVFSFCNSKRLKKIAATAGAIWITHVLQIWQTASVRSNPEKKSPLPLKFVAFQITNPLRVCIFAPIINNTYLCSTYFAYKLAFLFCGWVVMGETNQNCTTRLVICLMPKCSVPALLYFQPHQLKSLFLRSVRTLISQYRI